MTDKTQAPAGETKKPTKRLGVILRAAREDMGYTLAMCEAQLRVKEEYLLALENGHYHVLPTATHAKGFLRTYAQFLGMGDKLPALNQKFVEETTDMAAAPTLSLPTPMAEARHPGTALIMGGIIAAVGVYLVYLWLSAPEAPPEPIAPPTVEAPAAPETPPAAPTLVPMTETAPPAAPVAEVPATPAIAAPKAPESQVVNEEPAAPPAEVPAVAAPTPAPVAKEVAEEKEEEPAPKTKEEPAAAADDVADDVRKAPVAIRVTRDSWIQVQDAMGATIYSRLHAAGTTYVPPNQPGLTLTVGNAGGVRIMRKGVTGNALGRVAEVKRGIPLTPKED